MLSDDTIVSESKHERITKSSFDSLDKNIKRDQGDYVNSNLKRTIKSPLCVGLCTREGGSDSDSSESQGDVNFEFSTRQ
jgi:hypothetical protein